MRHQSPSFMDLGQSWVLGESWRTGGKRSEKRDPLHSLLENLLSTWPVLLVFIGLILGTKKSKDRRTPTGFGNSYCKHSLPTTQEKTLHMDITRWSTLKSDWLNSLQPKMEMLYIVSKNKTRSWLWFRSWTPYYQIQKKVGITTRPFSMT